MRIIFIRHGATKGNLEKRYIGITDEELSAEGINKLKKTTYPHGDKIIVSAMKRCIQTAHIIYPDREYIINEDLRECNFGIFENKSYEDLKDNKLYKDWLNSGGKTGFPEGESRQEFSARCCSAFICAVNTYSHCESLVFVVHGGTIMAILEKYHISKKDFYSWQIKNGEFSELKFENGALSF